MEMAPYISFNLHSLQRQGMMVMAGLVMLSACQTSNPNLISGGVIGQQTDDVITPLPAPLSDSLASNFLMARSAVYANDLSSATDFFTKSLVLDDNNPDLLRHAFLTQYQSGHIEEAAEIARRMEALNLVMPLASEPALIEAALAQDWEAVDALSASLAQSDTSVIIAGVTHSWSLLAQGQFAGAVTSMSQTATLLENDVGLSPAFMELQIIHLLEAGGAREEALSQLRNLRLLQNYPSHIQLSIAASYQRLGDADTAKDILTTYLSSSFDGEAIWQQFETGTHHLLAPMTITRGLAQSLLDTSWLDFEKSIRSLLLARAQLSLLLAPDFDAAHFVIAQEYLNLNQPDSATEHFTKIPADSAYHLPLQLSYFDYLRRVEKTEDALRHIQTIRLDHDENERVILAQADTLRALSRFEEAIPLYRQLEGGRFDTARLHRNLAICLERIGADEEAERYFLSSLSRNPDDAYTLNYLGYWYADENRNLDEAINYIKKAVELRPSSGFFADSLGWVYYRLGDLDNAVIWLERAIQLEPLDPVIIEHLADAYWQVGRDYEAVYKWQFARTQPELDDESAARLDNKLKQAELPDGQPLANDGF